MKLGVRWGTGADISLPDFLWMSSGLRVSRVQLPLSEIADFGVAERERVEAICAEQGLIVSLYGTASNALLLTPSIESVASSNLARALYIDAPTASNLATVRVLEEYKDFALRHHLEAVAETTLLAEQHSSSAVHSDSLFTWRRFLHTILGKEAATKIRLSADEGVPELVGVVLDVPVQQEADPPSGELDSSLDELFNTLLLLGERVTLYLQSPNTDRLIRIVDLLYRRERDAFLLQG